MPRLSLGNVDVGVTFMSKGSVQFLSSAFMLGVAVFLGQKRLQELCFFKLLCRTLLC